MQNFDASVKIKFSEQVCNENVSNFIVLRFLTKSV